MKMANIKSDLQTYINELISEQLGSQNRKDNSINNNHKVEIKDKTSDHGRDGEFSPIESTEEDI